MYRFKDSCVFLIKLSIDPSISCSAGRSDRPVNEHEFPSEAYSLRL